MTKTFEGFNLTGSGEFMGHLDLAKKYMDEHKHEPEIAVISYLASLRPDMTEAKICELAEILIRTTAKAITVGVHPQVHPNQVMRVAASIISGIYPCGVDAGMQAMMDDEEDEPEPDYRAEIEFNGIGRIFSDDGTATVLLCQNCPPPGMEWQRRIQFLPIDPLERIGAILSAERQTKQIDPTSEWKTKTIRVKLVPEEQPVDITELDTQP